MSKSYLGTFRGVIPDDTKTLLDMLDTAVAKAPPLTEDELYYIATDTQRQLEIQGQLAQRRLVDDLLSAYADREKPHG